MIGSVVASAKWRHLNKMTNDCWLLVKIVRCKSLRFRDESYCNASSVKIFCSTLPTACRPVININWTISFPMIGWYKKYSWEFSSELPSNSENTKRQYEKKNNHSCVSLFSCKQTLQQSFKFFRTNISLKCHCVNLQRKTMKIATLLSNKKGDVEIQSSSEIICRLRWIFQFIIAKR